MRVNHLTLSVTDVAANQVFFEKYFGLRCLGSLGKDGDLVTVLTDDTGFLLTLIHFPKYPVMPYPEHPETFHIGFMQDSPEQVDAIHARLVGDGIAAEAPHLYHGAWTFYFRAPGGFYVEVGHQSWEKRTQ